MKKQHVLLFEKMDCDPDSLSKSCLNALQSLNEDLSIETHCVCIYCIKK